MLGSLVIALGCFGRICASYDSVTLDEFQNAETTQIKGTDDNPTTTKDTTTD